MLPTSPGNKKALKHIQITNDNRYLIGGTKGSYLRVWNLADKEDFPMDFLLKSGKVTTILISLDGAYVYVAHITGVITVWISAKFSQCSELHDHQGSVNSLCQTNSKK